MSKGKLVVSNIDTALLTTGTIIGLADIYNILGVVLVSIQVAWILSKIGYRVVIKLREHLKDPNRPKHISKKVIIDTLQKEVETLKDELSGVRNG